MLEYIERGAVQKMINKLANEPHYYHRDETFFDGIATVNIDLCDIPTADVVEVVRCKDCEYFVIKPNYRLCSHKLNRTLNSLLEVSSNHFCSYGKRKEGAEE